MEYVKMTVSVEKSVHKALAEEAERRKVIVQELIRAVVLPEWIAHAKPIEPRVRIEA